MGKYTDADTTSLATLDGEQSLPLFSEAGSSSNPVDEQLPRYQDEPADSDEPPAFSKYTPDKKILSAGKIVSHDPHLNSDTEALFQWIRDEAEVPPLPVMIIEGTHRAYEWERRNGKRERVSKTVTDFRIAFDLSSFLNSGYKLTSAPTNEKRHRGTRLACKESNPEEGGKSVRDYCAAYVATPGRFKEFSLKKRIDGIDQDSLKKNMVSLIRATQYVGHLNITFPIKNRTVVVAPDNVACRWRYGWQRWVFYVLMLWIFTWPVLWIWTKAWDVVDALYTAREGADLHWIERWNEVVTMMVKQRRDCGDALYAPQHLQWSYCHELRAERQREARRERVQQAGGVLGFIGGVADVVQGLQNNTPLGRWGMDER